MTWARYLFLFSSCFVFARELLEDHIHCIQDGSDSLGAKIQEKAFNSYCYISDTFTLPNFANSKKADNFPYPGIGPIGTQDESNDLIYHNYYMWVPYLLLFQSTTFFIPLLVWFIRYFHQSWIWNLQIFLINVFMISFSTGKLRKTTGFGPIRSLLSFSTAQTD